MTIILKFFMLRCCGLLLFSSVECIVSHRVCKKILEQREIVIYIKEHKGMIKAALILLFYQLQKFFFFVLYFVRLSLEKMFSYIYFCYFFFNTPFKLQLRKYVLFIMKIIVKKSKFYNCLHEMLCCFFNTEIFKTKIY